MRTIAMICLALALAGCGLFPEVPIDSAIGKYYSVADQVQLSDPKDKALGILEPTQADLPNIYRKTPDKFLRDGVLVEIHYFRTGRQSDGLTTDDEFTPYVFNDGKLIAIGWQALGGPKSVGRGEQSAPQGGNQDMSFLCKDAIARGDSLAIRVHC